MADHNELHADLRRGGKAIARELYATDDEKTVRRVYHEVDQGMWPVFTLPGSTIILALASELREHALNQSREVAAEIAVAAKKAKVATKIKPKRRRGARPSSKAA